MRRFAIHMAALVLAMPLQAALAEDAPTAQPPENVRRVAEQVEKMLADKTRWHRLPAAIEGIAFPLEGKPWVRVDLTPTPDASLRHGTYRAVAEASARWPIAFETEGVIAASNDGRVLHSRLGYFDGRAWHAPEKYLRLPKWQPVIWQDGGFAAVVGREGIVRFGRGGWKQHPWKWEDGQDRLRILPGPGGTMTVWLGASNREPGPALVWLGDGDKFTHVTPKDGLPDDEILYAAAVGPRRLWVVARHGQVAFLDLDNPPKPRPPAELVRDWLDAETGQQRDEVLGKLRMQRPDAIAALQDALVESGRAVPPDWNRVRQLGSQLQAAISQCVRLQSAQPTDVTVARLEEWAGRIEELTAQLEQARTRAVAQQTGYERHRRLTALLSAVATGQEPGESDRTVTFTCRPLGMETGGHQWLWLVAYNSSDGSRILRLSPDGSQQAFGRGQTFYSDHAASAGDGPRLLDTRGRLWGWNGTEFAVLIDADRWPGDFRPAGCTADGWIWARRGRWSGPQEFWLVRPDAAGPAAWISPVVMEGMLRTQRLVDGRIVAVRGAPNGRLCEFRRGTWVDLAEGVPLPDACWSGQGGSVWAYGGGKLLAAAGGKTLLEGRPEDLCADRFEQVKKLAPTRAAMSAAPVRVGEALWFVNSRHRICRTIDGRNVQQAPARLSDGGLQRLAGPLDDGRTMLAISRTGVGRWRVFRIKVGQGPAMEAEEVFRGEMLGHNAWGRYGVAPAFFDGRGRFLAATDKQLIIIGAQETMRVNAAGLPALADRFGRIWMAGSRGLLLIAGDRVETVLPVSAGAHRPITVAAEDRALLTNSLDVIGVTRRPNGEWVPSGQPIPIRWPMPSGPFVGVVDGQAIFRSQGGTAHTGAIRLSDIPYSSDE